jgi:hypothetical protein
VAQRHREVLAKLDPVAVARYQLTEKDIRTIERYLKIIQATLEREGVSLWQQIMAFPSAYATSLAVHEIVEIRLLQAKGIDPFKLDTFALRRVLATHIEAHIQATYDEHLFLQDYINRHYYLFNLILINRFRCFTGDSFIKTSLKRYYQQLFQIGTLLKVNRDDDFETDLQLLLESDIGVVIVEDNRLEAAKQLMTELKG